jgi:TonB family protein
MLGADHPDVATTLLYLALGAIPDAAHPDERRQLFQRALDIRTKAFGASDLRVAEILTPLARLTHDETLYQRSLAILDATAADSAAAATTLELYSRFLRDGDRGAEAEPLETRAKQIRTARVAAIGANHPALSAAPGMRVGHGVTPPKLKRKTEPEYSDIARADKAQGTVVLKLDVGTDGLAHNIQLVRGIGLGLDENAAEAISRWEFIPGTLNGQPVTVMATVEVNFKLL